MEYLINLLILIIILYFSSAFQMAKIDPTVLLKKLKILICSVLLLTIEIYQLTPIMDEPSRGSKVTMKSFPPISLSLNILIKFI
jgi:hypothetical protein